MIELNSTDKQLKYLRTEIETIKSKQIMSYKSIVMKKTMLSSNQYDIQAYMPNKVRAIVYKILINHTNENNAFGSLSIFFSKNPDVMNNRLYYGRGSIEQGLAMISSTDTQTEYRLWAVSAKQAYVDDYMYFKLMYESSDDWTYQITQLATISDP